MFPPLKQKSVCNRSHTHRKMQLRFATTQKLLTLTQEMPK